MKKIAAIVPAYNEERAIAGVVNQIHASAEKEQLNIDVIVINDCSTDRTSEITAGLKCITLELPVNLGIGGVVQCGFQYAYNNGYDLAIRLDGDGQHPPEEIHKLINAYNEGAGDVIIGSRFLNHSGFQSSPMRRIGIGYFKMINKLFTGKTITDCTSGFQLLNRKALAIAIDYYPDEYPEPESVVLFTKRNLKISEVAVTMKERQGGKSSINNIASIYYLLKVSLAIFFTFSRLLTSKK